MTSEAITKESSTRICNHMNQDHKEAVHAYAKHYGKVKTFESARIIRLTPELIELKIDDQTLKIKFDHILKDCSDAHKTLVKMIKAIPKT
tara:strand:+ start:691 stop:960 length:270 start_codon:yes stop_codon:yes gene_type:complete